MPLKILIVEDSRIDADLAIHEVQQAGFLPEWKIVENEKDFLAELKNRPDIILSDFNLPQFDGLRAAQLLRESGLDIPFILISGSIGEDVAVEAMKHGATDYLLKDRISRLGSAVQRAIEQKRLRDERRRVETSLSLFRTLVDRSSDGIDVVDPETGRFIDVNTTTCERLGYTREELRGMTVADIETHTTPVAWPQLVNEIRRTGVKTIEGRQRRKDGSTFPVEVKVRHIILDREYLIASVRDVTERKLTEASLLENQKKFSLIFQSSPIAMALSTAMEGRYLDVNEEFLRVLQRPREEVIGYSSIELGIWSAEQRAVCIDTLQRQGSVRNLEMEIRGRDGLITPVLWSAEAIVIGGQNCLLGSLLDITDRKRAEQALRESEKKYRKIFENVQDVFYQTDLAGRIIEISPSIERYSGYTREELLGQPVENVYFDKADRAILLQKLQEKGEVADHEIRLKTKDGRLIYTSVNAHLLRGPDGVPRGVEGALRDVTERKFTQDELRLKTAFLEAQVDSSLDGLLVVDGRRKRVLQNQRFYELWKVPRHIRESNEDDAMLRFAVSQTKHPKEFVAKVDYLYARPEETSRDEIELIDGTILDRYSAPVRSKDGNYYGRIWAFRDITEQRRLELQFRQSQKMEAIGQLAGGVAHDFNNILAVIQLQAGLLKIQPNLTPKQLEFAAEIEKATQRASNLTRQLLLFSQRQVMQMRDLNLNDAVTNIVKMLQRIVGEDVQMQFKLSPKPLLIRADAGMIDQILLNLTVNSRDAMPGGGLLVIETQETTFDEYSVPKSSQARPGNFACLSVTDTGCGMPPEIISHIFEPFFTTKEVGKGTGLGLATVFGVVKQHQGWINVYSEVGRGTTMRIYLPRLASAAGPETGWSIFGSLPKGTETILIVEDDSAVRLSLRYILTHLGYRVLEATTGASALEVWEQNRDQIRLLLTDLVMPGGMNGRELAARIAEQDPSLKTIYLSGYSASVAGADFPLEEGVNFLTKPFETHKLAQAVRNRLAS